MPDPDAPPFGDDDLLVRPGPPPTWRDRVGVLADATGTTPARLAAGAVLLGVLLAAGLWFTRPVPPPPEVSLPFATTVTAAGPAVAEPTSSTAPAELVVHVAGAVARPGVLRLEPGARVVDAVDAAGGLAATADGARINLAAPVVDGERVYVPAVGEATPAPLGPTGSAAGPAAGEPAGPLDLNTADAAALETLPGVGPSTAAAIVAHRERVGRFGSVDELLDVRGIGTAKLEQLRPHVRV